MPLHTGSGLYSCPVESCQQAVSRVRDLRRHIKSHNKEKPWGCSFAGCGKRFTRKANMRSHQRSHIQGKAYACPEHSCARRFRLYSAMVLHRRQHTGERPWPCSFEGCNKRFTRRAVCQKHMKTHSAQKPFSCPVEGCRLAFYRHAHLRIHLLSHAGTGSFPAPAGTAENRLAPAPAVSWRPETGVLSGEPPAGARELVADPFLPVFALGDNPDDFDPWSLSAPAAAGPPWSPLPDLWPDKTADSAGLDWTEPAAPGPDRL